MDFYQWQEVASNQITCLLAAILFLACKTSESHRPIRDIYNIVSLERHPAISVEDLDKGYRLRKELIISTEHQILRVIRFQVEIDFPHQYLLNIGRILRLCCRPVHLAWKLLNDAYSSGEKVVLVSPALLACACLYCGLTISQAARRSSKMTADNNNNNHHSDGYSRDEEREIKTSWWQDFGIRDEDLIETSNSLLFIWQEICCDHPSETRPDHT
eukprot:gene4207-4623_t